MDDRQPILSRVTDLLDRCGGADAVLPATELYNEGWMLRLLLDWFARNRGRSHEFAFLPEVSWFSEAKLPSPFLPRTRGDPLAESYTHADGVVARFAASPAASGKIELTHDTQQFLVFEAKMGSTLSPGTKNAPGYDQAARTVACMAHSVGCTPVDLGRFKHLAYYVVAPRQQIAAKHFDGLVTRESIWQKVRTRVAQYGGARDEWMRDIFQPTFQRTTVALVSWETIFDSLPDSDEVASLREFYRRCQAYNLK